VRKIQADIFIDDRNIGGFPGWSKVWQMLHPEGGEFNHQYLDVEAHFNYPREKGLIPKLQKYLKVNRNG
jgi:hypothetical protein